ncbi:MAG: tRNA uridine-5-carboxymethylaminomethyl(34) synthesis GTPase MnmE [Candidatus Aminicenantales bacterium]
MLEDTIIAISTPPGYGGLGIVRLSGRRSLSIAKKIFRPRRKSWGGIGPRVCILGDLFDNDRNELVDEAYLSYFPAPRSYTKENVVEISCHGSPVVLEEVVRLGVRAGARLAHPGEFTLRAYLRGRIDIIQAEAVNDLITAASVQQAKISLGQLRGRLSGHINCLRSQVVDLISLLEASIEFSEENLGISPVKAAGRLENVLRTVERLIASYETGRAMTEGLNLAIVGRTNVGKSTLFNALLDHERAIVSPYPGTTRDYLRERIKIQDSFFQLIDMAGLERPSHPVERDGIKRSRELASRADGILLVLDASRRENPADLRLIEKYKKKKMIFVFNKADLPRKIDRVKCRAVRPSIRAIAVSSLKGTNISRLKSAILATFVPKQNGQDEVVLHLRQRLLFEQIASALEEALKRLREGYSEEVCAEEVRRVLPLLGQLTGEIQVDEVLVNIFSQFCVGK